MITIHTSWSFEPSSNKSVENIDPSIPIPSDGQPAAEITSARSDFNHGSWCRFAFVHLELRISTFAFLKSQPFDFLMFAHFPTLTSKHVQKYALPHELASLTHDQNLALNGLLPTRG